MVGFSLPHLHHPNGIRFCWRLADDVDFAACHWRPRRFYQNLKQRVTLTLFGEHLSAYSVSIHGPPWSLGETVAGARILVPEEEDAGQHTEAVGRRSHYALL